MLTTGGDSVPMLTTGGDTQKPRLAEGESLGGADIECIK
jgi:hypothetical protein